MNDNWEKSIYYGCSNYKFVLHTQTHTFSMIWTRQQSLNFNFKNYFWKNSILFLWNITLRFFITGGWKILIIKQQWLRYNNNNSKRNVVTILFTLRNTCMQEQLKIRVFWWIKIFWGVQKWYGKNLIFFYKTLTFYTHVNKGFLIIARMNRIILVLDW